MHKPPKSVKHKVPYKVGDKLYLVKDIYEDTSEDHPGGLMGRGGGLVIVIKAEKYVKDRETYCVVVCHEHILEIKIGFSVSLNEVCSDKRNCEKSLDEERKSLYNM